MNKIQNYQTNQKQQHNQNNLTCNEVILRVIYISIGFILVFSANYTFQTLASQVFDELNFEYLGQISIFTFYIFECMFCILSSHISTFFTHRQMMWASAASITLFVSFGLWIDACSIDHSENNNVNNDNILCSRYILYSSFILFTAISGSIEALMWCSVSAYIDIYYRLYPYKNELYFPVFFGVFQFVTIFGMAFAYFSLKLYSLTILYLGLIMFSFIGFIMLFMLPELTYKQENNLFEDSNCIDNDNNNQFIQLNEISHQNNQQINLLLISQVNEMNQIQQQPEQSQQTQNNIKQIGLLKILFSKDSLNSAILFKQYMFGNKTKRYILYFTISGITIGFIMSVINNAIQHCLKYKQDLSGLTQEESNYLNIKTTEIQLLIGFVEIIFYFIQGFIKDRINQQKMINISYYIIYASSLMISLAYLFENIILLYLSAILWAMSDSIFLNQSYAICSIQLNGSLLSYSLFNLCYGLGVSIMMILNILFLESQFYFLIFILFCFAVISQYIMANTIM